MTPTDNTKIEQVTEAIESLVLASCASIAESGRNITERRAQYLRGEVETARAGIATALRDLLRPTLRSVTHQEFRVAGHEA